MLEGDYEYTSTCLKHKHLLRMAENFYEGRKFSSIGNSAFTNSTVRASAAWKPLSDPSFGLVTRTSAASERFSRAASYTMNILLRYSFAMTRPWL